MPIKSLFVFAIFLSMLNAKEFLLADLCEIGIQNNPKIKSFGHKTSASHSYYDQSIDRYKPHLNVSGQIGNQNYHYEYPNERIPYQGNAYNYNLSLKQPIYRAQLIEGIKDAEARKMLAQMQEKDEKAKLVTMILQGTVESIRQREIIEILTKKQTLLQGAYEKINQKFEVKLASSVDKYQALAKLKESSSDLAKAKQHYAYSLYNLRLLTKYEDVEKYISSLDFNTDAVIKAFNKSKFRSIKESTHKNTRIKLDEQSAEIAKIQIGLRNSERSPQIDATLSYGDAGGNIDTVTRQNESRAMLSLNFPLFQGGYVDDRVKESKYLFYAAQEEAENTKLNIKIALEKALQNIKGGIESTKAQRVAVTASRKYFEGAAQSYASGVSSLTDAYLAEADYRDNQLRLVYTEADIFNSIMDGYYFIGETKYREIKKMQQKFFK